MTALTASMLRASTVTPITMSREFSHACHCPVRAANQACRAYYDGQHGGQYQQNGYYDDRGQQGYQDEYYSDQYYDQGGAHDGYAQNGYALALTAPLIPELSSC